jgi:hypothetical protein
MHDRRAAMSLVQLRPKPGDVVQIPPFAGRELRIVASVASDGLLYFRGGPGQKIRPHRAYMYARQTFPRLRAAGFTLICRGIASLRIVVRVVRASLAVRRANPAAGGDIRQRSAA